MLAEGLNPKADALATGQSERGSEAAIGIQRPRIEARRSEREDTP
jgi:hypothetical protein